MKRKQTVSLLPLAAVLALTHARVPPVPDPFHPVLEGRVAAWGLSNQTVASVSATALVTALSVGFATISATSEGQTGTATIKVVRSGQAARPFPWKEIVALCGLLRCDEVVRSTVDEVRWRARRPIGFHSRSVPLTLLLLVALGLISVGLRANVQPLVGRRLVSA